MLAHAIPRYRLPPDALAQDIEDILANGIEVLWHAAWVWI